jgi:hypothetical protein
VKVRDYTIEISGTLVIDDRDATKIDAIVSRDGAHCFLVAENSDSCEALTGSLGGGDHRAGIVSFGQDDVLRP